MEVILDKFQGGIIIANHQIGIFSHYMHLLNLLFVELVEHAVVVLLVAQSVVLDTSNVHGIIEHKKASLKFQCINLRQVEQCLLNILQLNIPQGAEEVLTVGFQVVKQFNHRELNTYLLCIFFSGRWYKAVEPFNCELAYLHAFFKTPQCGAHIPLSA